VAWGVRGLCSGPDATASWAEAGLASLFGEGGESVFCLDDLGVAAAGVELGGELQGVDGEVGVEVVDGSGVITDSNFDSRRVGISGLGGEGFRSAADRRHLEDGPQSRGSEPMANGDTSDGVVEAVESGDTLRIRFTSGPRAGTTWRVHPDTVDAYEVRGPNKFAGQAAVVAVGQWLDTFSRGVFVVEQGQDQYGRLVGQILGFAFPGVNGGQEVQRRAGCRRSA